jgi:uncharacterized membrane protein YgcG
VTAAAAAEEAGPGGTLAQGRRSCWQCRQAPRAVVLKKPQRRVPRHSSVGALLDCMRCGSRRRHVHAGCSPGVAHSGGLPGGGRTCGGGGRFVPHATHLAGATSWP